MRVSEVEGGEQKHSRTNIADSRPDLANRKRLPGPGSRFLLPERLLDASFAKTAARPESAPPRGRASSSARSSTSSTESTRWKVMVSRRCLGTSSSRFFSFRRGRMTVRTPARRAASTFSLMPPTGEDAAGQRHLSRHRQPRLDGPLAHQRSQRRDHGHAGRRAVLRDGAGRDVDVDVRRVPEIGPDAEIRRRASAPTTARPARTPSSRRRAGR